MIGKVHHRFIIHGVGIEVVNMRIRVQLTKDFHLVVQKTQAYELAGVFINRGAHIVFNPQPAHHLVQQKVRGAADNNIVLPLHLGVSGLNLVYMAVPKLHHIFLNVLYLNIISFQEGSIRLQR